LQKVFCEFLQFLSGTRGISSVGRASRSQFCPQFLTHFIACDQTRSFRGKIGIFRKFGRNTLAPICSRFEPKVRKKLERWSGLYLTKFSPNGSKIEAFLTFLTRLAGLGVTLDQGAISRIVSAERYLMDYELIAIARALRVKPSTLVD
jgi:hypothetical protein